MYNIFTNEQILEILNTWTVLRGDICYSLDSIGLWLKHNNFIIKFYKINSNPEYDVTIRLYNSSQNPICEPSIYCIKVPQEIILDVDYLVTKKVKDYMKSKLTEMFDNKEANGFDALMND